MINYSEEAENCSGLLPADKAFLLIAQWRRIFDPCQGSEWCIPEVMNVNSFRGISRSLTLLVSPPALTPHNLWIYYTSSQCLMALDCFADCLYIIQESCKICDQHEKVTIKRATATWEQKNTDLIVFPSANKIEVACLFACFIERLIRFDLSLIKM